MVNIQPIQVCDDAGANCANTGLELFLAETNKIWDQAEITMNFLGWMTVNSSRAVERGRLRRPRVERRLVDRQHVVRQRPDGLRRPDLRPVRLRQRAGRVAITDSVFAFNGGIGRLDTIAHELGHVLGLGHGDFGAGGAENLMTAGSARSIPDSIGDIAPDGDNLDQLTAAQIAQATSSDFAQPATSVPEPGTLGLVVFGLLGAVTSGRRRQRA